MIRAKAMPHSARDLTCSEMGSVKENRLISLKSIFIICIQAKGPVL